MFAILQISLIVQDHGGLGATAYSFAPTKSFDARLSLTFQEWAQSPSSSSTKMGQRWSTTVHGVGCCQQTCLMLGAVRQILPKCSSNGDVSTTKLLRDYCCLHGCLHWCLITLKTVKMATIVDVYSSPPTKLDNL